jgi:hypothetical protein
MTTHACGSCGGTLQAMWTDDDGHHWYECKNCGEEHGSLDCCCKVHTIIDGSGEIAFVERGPLQMHGPADAALIAAARTAIPWLLDLVDSLAGSTQHDAATDD